MRRPAIAREKEKAAEEAKRAAVGRPCASPAVLPSALRSLDHLWAWSMKAPGTTQFARHGRNGRIVPEFSSDPQQLKSSRAFEAAGGALPTQMSVTLSFQCCQQYGRLGEVVEGHLNNCSVHVVSWLIFELTERAIFLASAGVGTNANNGNHRRCCKRRATVSRQPSAIFRNVVTKSANRGILVTTSSYELSIQFEAHRREAGTGCADTLRFSQRRRAQFRTFVERANDAYDTGF